MELKEKRNILIRILFAIFGIIGFLIAIYYFWSKYAKYVPTALHTLNKKDIIQRTPIENGKYWASVEKAVRELSKSDAKEVVDRWKKRFDRS